MSTKAGRRYTLCVLELLVILYHIVLYAKSPLYYFGFSTVADNVNGNGFAFGFDKVQVQVQDSQASRLDSSEKTKSKTKTKKSKSKTKTSRSRSPRPRDVQDQDKSKTSRHNFSIAGPSVDHFSFNTLPDLQEYYLSCILESDLTQIYVFFIQKKMILSRYNVACSRRACTLNCPRPRPSPRHGKAYIWVRVSF